MCGRYRRKSDKKRIADAFEVSSGLEELDLAPEDDIAPGSIQPVVSVNQEGERQIELMRWGFKLPDRLLFNARSEGIETSKFWKDAFLKGRAIVPADEASRSKQAEQSGVPPSYFDINAAYTTEELAWLYQRKRFIRTPVASCNLLDSHYPAPGNWAHGFQLTR